MRIAAAAMVIAIVCTPALAQDRTPAVNSPNTTNPAAPVEGANSFSPAPDERFTSTLRDSKRLEAPHQFQQ
jgi:hypothetical protein